MGSLGCPSFTTTARRILQWSIVTKCGTSFKAHQNTTRIWKLLEDIHGYFMGSIQLPMASRLSRRLPQKLPAALVAGELQLARGQIEAEDRNVIRVLKWPDISCGGFQLVMGLPNLEMRMTRDTPINRMYHHVKSHVITCYNYKKWP